MSASSLTYRERPARGDAEGLRQTITRALRLCFFLGIPSGAGMVALARPIVEAIFLRKMLSSLEKTTSMTGTGRDQVLVWPAPASTSIDSALRRIRVVAWSSRKSWARTSGSSS